MNRSTLSFLLAVTLGLAVASPGQAAVGWIQLFQNGQRLVNQLSETTSFTLDEAVQIGNVFVSQWAHFGDAWAYVDDAGRLRASASTGDHRGPTLTGRAVSTWTGTGSKQSPADVISFVLHPTELLVNSAFPVNGPPSSARWLVDITVCGPVDSPALECRTAFNQEISVAGGRLGSLPLFTVTRTERKTVIDPVTGAADLSDRAGGPVTGVFSWPVFSSDPALYRSDEYQGEVPLAGIDVGAAYTVQIQVSADVYLTETSGESQGVAEAIVANVLDTLAADSGLELLTTDLDQPNPPRLCAEDFNPDRFDIHSDGTLTDRYTALQWQRCPLGMVLNDAGTAGLADDSCEAAGQLEYSWGAALAAAASDNLAGVDWQLPNVKELATLVSRCVAPAIDTLAFPGTPPEPFWTGTPAAAPQSRQLQFQTGEVLSAPRDQLARARLVRATGDDPVTPLPTISIGKAGVVEGDSGLTQLVFPVLVNPVQDQAVTVDYAVVGLTATAGPDFSPTAGTLTIPAEEELGSVAVTVVGDVILEGEVIDGAYAESLRLDLSNPSPGLRLVRSAAVGYIFDDEPVVSLRPRNSSEVLESDGQQTFEVVLNRAAAQAVTVNYLAEAGSAQAGTDFDATQGQVTLQPGELTREVTVNLIDDAARENEEAFDFSLSGLTGPVRLGARRVTTRIVDDEVDPSMLAANDSGVTYCVNEDSEAAEACPMAGYPGQDAEFGRDLTDPDPDDGAAGFSFTKLDAQGVPLVDQTLTYNQQPWSCVLDNVTGLVWEVKNQNSPRDLHYLYWDFTWYNSSGVNDGGDPGVRPALGGNACWDTNCGDASNPLGGANCDLFQPMQCSTEDFIAQVNDTELCGFSDWRLPTGAEAFNLLNVDRLTDDLPDAYFPGAFGGSAWTSHTDAQDPSRAWIWTQRTGSVAPGLRNNIDKSSELTARLVRGSSQP